VRHSADECEDRQAVSRGCGIDNLESAPLHRFVKWRNQLLALFCLFVFAGLGVLYFQHWVIQKPFGIILFIGEGLGPERLAATRVYVGGADAHLALDSMSHLALMTNASKDFAVSDSAAAASAIATGAKVNNGAIAIGPNGKPLTSIVELARQRGRAIGLVTNGKLTGPVCAAFYAHARDAGDEDNLASELIDGGRIDIAMGGGGVQFLPETKGGQRQDGRDLLLELRGNGFDIVSNRAELEGIPAWRRPKLFGVFRKGELAFASQLDQWSEQPSLPDMVRRAIELLQYNSGGYLLVVDAALMGKAAQQNDAERTFEETAELDRAVSVARGYAGPKSTIIVGGDVAIGGLSLNGFPFRKDSGLALLGLNSAGQPWITWASGPKGTRSYGTPKVPEGNGQPEAGKNDASEPAAIYTKSALNTVEDVVAFGTGPATEALRGSIDNTQIFKIIRDEL
jgi:alkaline phosphatase